MMIIRLLLLAICFNTFACQNRSNENSFSTPKKTTQISIGKILQIHSNSISLFIKGFPEKVKYYFLSANQPSGKDLENYADEQRTVIQLVSLSLFLLFGVTAFLFWSRRKIKITNKILAENNDFIADLNEEIHQQFELIKQKNQELDKYQNHLEVLVEERTKEMITAKKKAKESDMLKATLLSNIYHEIRTPLNAIMGFTQLLGIEENIKNVEYLKIIDKNADDLLVLVDNIIELSKLQSENPNIEVEKVLIKDMMETLHTETIMIKEAHRKDKIEIISNFNKLGDGDYLYTNKEMLDKILKQLIDNALKYTSQGRICIGYECSNNQATFSVSDTGIGIEKEKLPSIFNAFHKIEDHDNLHRGIGIGLTLAKQFTKKIKGTLNVESEFKKGTKFSLSVPV